MISPFTGGETVLLTETRTTVFRKEEYEYTYICYANQQLKTSSDS